MSQFKGPKAGGQVTPATLFRGNFAGDEIGPYLSQFFMHDIPYGSQFLDGRIRRVRGHTDYMTDEENWRAVQRGCDFDQDCELEEGEVPFRFITNGRDLGQFVHVDNDYYGVYNACLLLAAGNPASPPPMPTRRCEAIGGLGVPFAPGLPYVNPLANPAIFPPSLRQSKNQIGVNTFGVQHLKSLILQAVKRALDAVWYQKWNVHRRLRPEVFAARIHFQKNNAPRANYPFDIVELAKLGDKTSLNSLLYRVYFHNNGQNGGNKKGANGTYLLPMAYAEGSPLHPSYGQGHATVAGACVTILKAFFADVPFAQLGGAQDVDANGAVQNYAGADAPLITVHGELHKLASNIGLGRDFAGVHYRSDYVESVLLGEAVALALLEDQFATFNEEFRIEFRRFNGDTYCLEKTRCGRVV